MAQGQLFDPAKVNAQQFSPVATARQAAAALTGGRWSDEGLSDLQVDPVRGHATFLAYRNAMHSARPETPGLRSSYDAMAAGTAEQYAHMTRPTAEGGMGLTHEVVDHDPYDSPAALAHDIGQGRIRTLATSATGPHEYFSDAQNDQFRAVHDVFGHAAIGRGFSRHGEEAAFRSHRQMYPEAAHAALATETRGQNSYLNYGPGGFASQEGRLVGLPRWAENDQPVPPARRTLNRQQFNQGSLF